jgi:hypothetical protein
MTSPDTPHARAEPRSDPGPSTGRASQYAHGALDLVPAGGCLLTVPQPDHPPLPDRLSARAPGRRRTHARWLARLRRRIGWRTA